MGTCGKFSLCSYSLNKIPVSRRGEGEDIGSLKGKEKAWKSYLNRWEGDRLYDHGRHDLQSYDLTEVSCYGMNVPKIDRLRSHCPMSQG